MDENNKVTGGSLGPFTPERISALAPNEVFVFGSNLGGFHAGGAARAAMNHFGAIWGQGVGLQGQSYAIPTMHGGVDVIKPYVDEFIQFALARPDLFFYVTRIGCGIAGFKDEEIAPLFAEALSLDNVALPTFAVLVLTLGACTTQGNEGENSTGTEGQDKGQAAIENIMSRTSIRKYKDQPVEQEKIDIMLKAAMAAPTAVNLQPWHFIVITDKETIGLLSGKQPTNAPLLIAVCGDTDKTTTPDGKMKLPDFWVEDVSAATENLLLAAHALGLGAVWTGVYPAMERVSEVANVLNCPQNIVPVVVVRVGYPDESPAPKDKFNEENISYDKFGGKKK